MSGRSPRRAQPTSRRGIAALRYAALRWPVLPLHAPSAKGSCSCGAPDCAKPGKHPRSRRGLHDATTRASQVAAWWTSWPDANVGVATGRLVVIDVDSTDSLEALAALEAAHAPLPPTLTASTGRGQHIYFAAGEHRIGNSAGRLGPGLDVRGRGGYVIVPPSDHVDGRRYSWQIHATPAPLPKWLASLLVPAERRPAPPVATRAPATRTGRRVRYFQAALDAELADVAAAQPGVRNDTLNRASFRLGQLAASGHGDVDGLPELLLHAALAAGLTETEAVTTISSGLQAGQQHPRPTTLAR